MNEITIGDKIYISSKRAAEVTGYAKDYVGQLCREGHVDAKMVGRSWYVYEPSIRAHRFGIEEEKPQSTVENSEELIHIPIDTWQKPVYTAESLETLPEIAKPVYEELLLPAEETLTDMQAAWKEWFERKQEVLETPEIESPEVIEIRNEAAHVGEEEDTEEQNQQVHEYAPIPEEPEEVSVPLRRIPEKVYMAPEDVEETAEAPAEPIAIHHIIATPQTRREAPAAVYALERASKVNYLHTEPQARIIEERVVSKKGKKNKRKAIRTRSPRTSNAPIIALLLGISLLSVAVALIGSGHADRYLKTFSSENPVIEFLVGTSEFKR